jgi:two-component system cell cycle response regulator
VNPQISRARLLQMKKALLTDELTGLYNRRFINRRLPIDLKRLRKKNLGIFLLDIDHFKSINDTYGHVAGDAVLLGFARLLLQILPNESWAARYGGEEFLICVRQANPAVLPLMAEQIRRIVECSRFVWNGSSVSLTCSIGVHSFDASDGNLTVKQVIEIVDRKCYRAKRIGRNKVIAYEENFNEFEF